MIEEEELDWESHSNPFLRIAGRDLPAAAVLERALATLTLPVQPIIARAADQATDYTQIDPLLPIVAADDPVPAPPAGIGYAGLTARQRGFFYNWLSNTDLAAPPAYQRLYLAYLETHLFLGKEEAAAARATLLDLLENSAWSITPDLTRSALLAGWLAQDDQFLARVIGRGDFSPGLMGIALAWQALLNHPLSGKEVLAAQQVWRAVADTDPPAAEIVQLNVDSLASALGADPLRYALHQIAPESTPEPAQTEPAQAEAPPLWHGAWKAWRCAHRDLVVGLPQPDLRAQLSPLLNELLQTAHIFTQHEASARLLLDVSDEDEEAGDADEGVDTATPNWYLVLEFSESRSQFYDHVVFVAQKQPNYHMIMDEGRQIIHRLIYQKRQMRQFWRIWEYVQNWSSTRVYVNGQELEKWKIWPYSPSMR